MVSFTGISSKQAQALELLQNHISLPDVEVAVAQSDLASISIKGENGARVDLPAPVSPRMPSLAPAGTWKSTDRKSVV